MGLSVIVSLVVIWLHRHDPTLVDIAHAVGPRNTTQQSWKWLSDTELLVVTTDREADNLLGAVNEEIHWQGHVDRWNIASGKRTRLPEFTALLNREGISPVDIPTLDVVSPNGIWVKWDNRKTLDHWNFPATAHLDGTHYREWNSNTRGAGFFLNDQQWIEQDERDKSPMTYTFDLQDKRKDRKYPSSAPQAKALAARYNILHPHFVSVDLSPQADAIEIFSYRTEDQFAFDRSKHNSSLKGPRPLRKTSVKLPHRTLLMTGEASPQQDRVFYHLHTDYVNPLLAFLHRFRPSISEAPLPMESLWVSNIEGKDFHEIGFVLVPHQTAEDISEHGKQPALSQVEWLPGGKKISFVYRKVLYVVPAN